MRKRAAFTLVELLVVIGLIAILIGLLMPLILDSRDRANSVACQSNLRQLYCAQNFYADANRGKYATPQLPNTWDPSWQVTLAQMLTKQQDANYLPVYRCPADEPQGALEIASYGVNTHLFMLNWQSRRDRKTDVTRIILMGEKPSNGQDYLVSEDKYFLTVQLDTPFWLRALKHNGSGSYRHTKGTGANFLMCDGHVEQLGRGDLLRDGGHWYWGDPPLAPSQNYYGPCCY